MDKAIDQLNKKWKTLEAQITLNEENVKKHFVEPFLGYIGYDEKVCLFDYEHHHQNGRVDIFVKMLGTNEGIYVEIKRGNMHLGADEIKQLVNYMLLSNITWGILTNGREYYLINKDIVSSRNNESGDALLDKVVLVCDWKQKKKFIKYFSQSYLFEKRKTLFIRDIAQFKAYKNYPEVSWRTYFSTLYGFFDYYCEELEPDLVIPSSISHTYLSDIREKDFIQYLLTLKPKKKGKEKVSPNIIKAKCSHIEEMYREFENRKIISTNNLRTIRNNALEHLTNEDCLDEKNSTLNYLTAENIDVIISNFTASQKNKDVIRLIIFCLVAYYGYTKSEVVDFLLQSWDCIDWKNKSIYYRGIKKSMPVLLEENLKKIQKIRGRKKSILGANGERGQSISRDVVTEAFEWIKRMDDVEGRELFTPEYVRKMLVVELFKGGYSIEEIAAYMGIDISSIGACIESVEKGLIIKCGLKRLTMKNRQKSVHPFEKQFNKI